MGKIASTPQPNNAAQTGTPGLVGTGKALGGFQKGQGPCKEI